MIVIYFYTHRDSELKCNPLERVCLGNSVFDQNFISFHMFGGASVFFERLARITN